MTKEKWTGVTEAVVLVVLGILLMISIVASSIIDYLIGVALLTGGLTFLAIGFIQKKNVVNINAAMGTLLVGAGIAALITRSISFFIGKSISWFLFVFGLLILINGIVWLAVKNKRMAAGISATVIGTVLAVLGALLLFPMNDPVIDQSIGWVIYGAVFVLMGIFLLVLTVYGGRLLTNKKKAK